MTAKLSKISATFIWVALIILSYGIYTMFYGRTDKQFLITLAAGFLTASLGILFDTYSWSSYSRERRQQKRFQLVLNYFSIVSMAATLVYLCFWF